MRKDFFKFGRKKQKSVEDIIKIIDKTVESQEFFRKDLFSKIFRKSSSYIFYKVFLCVVITIGCCFFYVVTASKSENLMFMQNEYAGGNENVEKSEVELKPQEIEKDVVKKKPRKNKTRKKISRLYKEKKPRHKNSKEVLKKPKKGKLEKEEDKTKGKIARKKNNLNFSDVGNVKKNNGKIRRNKKAKIKDNYKKNKKENIKQNLKNDKKQRKKKNNIKKKNKGRKASYNLRVSPFKRDRNKKMNVKRTKKIEGKPPKKEKFKKKGLNGRIDGEGIKAKKGLKLFFKKQKPRKAEKKKNFDKFKKSKSSYELRPKQKRMFKRGDVLKQLKYKKGLRRKHFGIIRSRTLEKNDKKEQIENIFEKFNRTYKLEKSKGSLDGNVVDDGLNFEKNEVGEIEQSIKSIVEKDLLKLSEDIENIKKIKCKKQKFYLTYSKEDGLLKKVVEDDEGYLEDLYWDSDNEKFLGDLVEQNVVSLSLLTKPPKPPKESGGGCQARENIDSEIREDVVNERIRCKDIVDPKDNCDYVLNGLDKEGCGLKDFVDNMENKEDFGKDLNYEEDEAGRENKYKDLYSKENNNLEKQTKEEIEISNYSDIKSHTSENDLNSESKSESEIGDCLSISEEKDNKESGNNELIKSDETNDNLENKATEETKERIDKKENKVDREIKSDENEKTDRVNERSIYSLDFEKIRNDKVKRNKSFSIKNRRFNLDLTENSRNNEGTKEEKESESSIKNISVKKENKKEEKESNNYSDIKSHTSENDLNSKSESEIEDCLSILEGIDNKENLEVLLERVMKKIISNVNYRDLKIICHVRDELRKGNKVKIDKEIKDSMCLTIFNVLYLCHINKIKVGIHYINKDIDSVQKIVNYEKQRIKMFSQSLKHLDIDLKFIEFFCECVEMFKKIKLEI